MSELFVGLFYIQSCEDQSDQQIEAHGHPQIHDMEHVHAGCGLLGSAAHIAGKGQKPAGQSGSDTAAQLGAQGRYFSFRYEPSSTK